MTPRAWVFLLLVTAYLLVFAALDVSTVSAGLARVVGGVAVLAAYRAGVVAGVSL